MSRKIAFNDALNHRTIFFPDFFRVCAKGDVLLKVVGNSEWSLNLGGTDGESLGIVSDEIVENLLELFCPCSGIKRQARKSNCRFTEKPRLKPRQSRIYLLVSLAVADEKVCIVLEKIQIGRYISLFLYNRCEFAGEPFCVFNSRRARNNHRFALSEFE